MLETFGVDPAAEAVYLAMLRKPDAGVTGLSEYLGWTRAEVEAALDELGRLALLRPSWEDPAVLRPVSPTIGLEILLAREKADLLRRQHRIEQGRATLEALAAEFGQPVAGGTGIEELSGLDATREALERLAYHARHEVLAFGPDGAQRPESMAAARPLNEYLLGKGVRMRTVYLNSARNDAPTCAYARWLSESGAELRTVPVLPVRMLIVDRSHAVVPIDPADTAAGACLLRGTGVIAALTALFEQVWQVAEVWGGTRRAAPKETLTAQERALLHLLLQGDTDEQAGRRLGVSTRTVGRIAADLMSRLGARSRFQTGALAASRGWLAPESPAAPATDRAMPVSIAS